MTDKEFNQKIEKFLNDNNFSKADIAGMYVLCNEREHDLKQELSNHRAALASRENELRYKETVIKELNKEIETLKVDKELQEQEIRRLKTSIEMNNDIMLTKKTKPSRQKMSS